MFVFIQNATPLVRLLFEPHKVPVASGTIILVRQRSSIIQCIILCVYPYRYIDQQRRLKLNKNEAISPPCRPPSSLVVKKKKGEVTCKSCFKAAENRSASSLQVGAHRYTRISCVSKFLWFQGDLKPFFFKAINSLKSIQRSRESLEIVQNQASSSFRYGYGVIKLIFVRVKSQMDLERFENVPRTQTPLNSISSPQRIRKELIFGFCFDGAENRAALSLWVGNFSVSTDFVFSKLLRVQSHLKSDFFFRKKILNSI